MVPACSAGSLPDLFGIAFVYEGAVLSAAFLSVRISWDFVVPGKTASFSFWILFFVVVCSAVSVFGLCYGSALLTTAATLASLQRKEKEKNEMCCE